jgi:digeranylgeranylglycerophospholipid reductase
MKLRYEVIVVVGGSVGSYTAYQLGNMEVEVYVLDEKEEIGKNVLCAGVMSKEAFRHHDLSNESVCSRIDAFTFVSLSGQRLEYAYPDVFFTRH